MRNDLKWKSALVVFVVALCLWMAYPLDKKINLGLDLQGGMHLVVKADIEKLPEDSRKDATSRVIETLRNRIDQFGVSEPLIQKQGKDRILIQLPGVTDRERALQVIKQTAHMEFRLVEDDEKKVSAAVKGNVPAGYELKSLPDGTPVLLEEKAALAGDSLVNAQAEQSSTGIYPQVIFSLDSKGARSFARLTKDNIDKRLAIVLDGVVKSAPVIRSEIPSGTGQIEGQFSWEEAADLALILRTGALPVPIEVEEERTVGATLGKDSIEKGVKASIVGAILVAGFIGIYYLLGGLIADFALCINVIIILAALAYFKATLTLPGIAGMILTVGMAVDSNVLIFERMREEMRKGKLLKFCVSAGYDKAFSAIFDSNLTTLLSALILFKVGTGPIRGFAVTLAIGIVASMFTALVITRLIFDFLLLNKGFGKIKFLQFFKDTRIDFLKKRHIAYLVSLIVIAAGIVSFVVKGSNNLGVDFTGGTLEQIKFEKPVELDEIRSIIKEAGISSAQLQRFGENNNEILIKTDTGTTAVIEKGLSENLKDNKFEVLKVEEVGPVVGKELKTKAIIAITLTLLGILIYVSFRFEFIFAVGGIVALFHDALVTLGILSLLNYQISLGVVAAVMTILGYSINDTIVIFDRIRENVRLGQTGKKDFKKIINTALNETLSRTILTSGTVLMVVLSLFIFGGIAIRDFALTMLIGLISGTYSTVYIAAPILIDWQYKGKKR